MSNGRISVIMSVYNNENTIIDCIDSIIAQTYKNWELIVCNDCSYDKTQFILEEYKKKLGNSMIIIVNDYNMKLAASLNRCLEHVTGDFIARMDADDINHKERFKVQVEYLNEHPDISLVGSNCFIFEDNINDIKTERVTKEYPTIKDIVTSTPFIHPSILARKNVFEDTKGYRVSKDTERGQDIDLWFRVYQKGFKSYNIQKNLIYYRESKCDLKRRTMMFKLSYLKTRIRCIRELNLDKKYYFFLLPNFINIFITPRLHFYIERWLK